MTSLLYRLGHTAARRPWTVIGLWAFAAIVVIASSSMFGAEMEDSFDAPGVDSAVAVDLLSREGSDRAGLTARVVAAGELGFDNAGERAELDTVRDQLAALPNVLGVDEIVSPSGSVAMLTVQYPVLEALSVDDLDLLKETVARLRDEVTLDVEAGGDLFFSYEEAGSGNAELIGVGAAVVILLVAFGSLIAMGLPIGVAIFGLAVGLGLAPLVGHLIAMPSWAPDMGAMIGLGVGIDYALFLVSRHREFLGQGQPVPEAAGRAVATAGQSVVFAGGTVVVAVLGLSIAGLPFLTAMAIATSIVVLVMVLASITLLPALLGLSGTWIDRLGIHRRGHGAAHGASPGWRRWGAHVTRHAWPYAIGVTAALLALSAPVLALTLGFPDEGTQPESTTQRRAYDLAAEGFGPGINGPLVIAVDLGGAVDRHADVLDELAAAIAADPGIATASPADVDPTSDVASIIAVPSSAPQDDATYETVQRLRDDVFPSVLDGTGTTAHVGGQTAGFGDVARRVADRLVVFVVAVIAVSFVLLMFVFRSVLVPLKAAILNLLSIGAAYGVLVMVFQWGWGKDLIGLEATVPVVSFIPMFMFAVLFGLSMDYEVFLLSRVREEYVATGDNEGAVVTGLAGTARVITSAALIMIAVFGAFVLGADPMVKMLGLGMATAILIDATVVRVVLVPATMKLMGDANWWLPRVLDRRLPRVDLDGGAVRTDPTHAGDAEPELAAV